MFGHLSDPDIVASPLTRSHYKQRHQRLYSRKLPLMLIDVIYALLIPQYAHPISLSHNHQAFATERQDRNSNTTIQ